MRFLGLFGVNDLNITKAIFGKESDGNAFNSEYNANDDMHSDKKSGLTSKIIQFDFSKVGFVKRLKSKIIEFK